MTALNVLFWAWCVALALVAVASVSSARRSGGDATGGLPEFLFGALAAGLLVLSLAARLIGRLW